MLTIRTIDAHTAGEPLRLIVDGFPTVEGGPCWNSGPGSNEHCDHLRTALMLEPRGHTDMYGALLTPPEHPGSDAGVLFMHNQGYSTMCGHGDHRRRHAGDRARADRAASAGRDRARRAGRAGPRRRAGGSRGRADAGNAASASRTFHRSCCMPACRCGWIAHGAAPTWLLAARSTRSSTARRLASRSCRIGSTICGAPGWTIKREIEHGHGGRASRAAVADRHLRHDLHRPGLVGGCRPAQCDDLRRR